MLRPSPLAIRERELVIQYLLRQASGCEKRAEELDRAGEPAVAALQRALAETLGTIADRIEAGAHRA